MTHAEQDPAEDGGFEPTGEGVSSWWWRFSDNADVVVDQRAPQFASQQGAEDWLAENFAELADQGVAAVSLFDGERAVYGPMPLSPDG